MIYDNKTFEFKGIPSGDGESFCWDVDKETFIKIKGIEPEVSDQSFYNNELYMIYPNDLYSNTGVENTHYVKFLNKIVIKRILDKDDYIFIGKVAELLTSKYYIPDDKIEKSIYKFKQILIKDPNYIYHYDEEYWAKYINDNFIFEK